MGSSNVISYQEPLFEEIPKDFFSFLVLQMNFCGAILITKSGG